MMLNKYLYHIITHLIYKTEVIEAVLINHHFKDFKGL